MNLYIDPLQWFLVFVGMLMLDAVWARYTRAVADRVRGTAAYHAVVIILLTGFVTTSYVGDALLLIPAALGAWLGTYITVGRK